VSTGGDDARVSAVESRAASLEAQVTYLNIRADRLEAKADSFGDRLARLEERVAHLPTKELVVRIAIGAVIALSAILVFADTIRALFGLRST